MTTFYGTTADNRVNCSDATYLTARSGGGTLSAGTVSATTHSAGQAESGGTFTCYQYFLAFDTSSIPDGATITDATLSVYLNTDSSGTDHVQEARSKDWDTTVDTGDYVAGANWTGQTLLASISTSGIGAAGYKAFTSEAALLSSINKTGYTRMVICSDRFGAGTAPGAGTSEFIGWQTGDAANPPKLDVTYTSDFTQTSTDNLGLVDAVIPALGDSAATITDELGLVDAMSAVTTYATTITDVVGGVDSSSSVAVYVRTISDHLSVIESWDVVHGRVYPRKGRTHGAESPASVPYRSRILRRG